MPDPGDRRLTSTTHRQGRASPARRPDARHSTPGTLLPALAGACAATLFGACAWAVLRGVLELGVGSLLVAFLGGWGVGASLRGAGTHQLLAAVLSLAGWLLGLVLTWLVAMAILPGSSRTIIERIEGTPFLDWLSPQFGLLEVAGLVLWVAIAAYAARSPVQP